MDKIQKNENFKQKSRADEALFEEKTIRREDIFEGKVLHLFRDEIALPNGVHSIREYAVHRGAVAVVALDGANHVYLVR